MKMQHGLISLFATNKIQARKKAEEFLRSYQKEKIRILAVEGLDIEGQNNNYEIEVQYYDNYEYFATFRSEDYIKIETEEEKQLKYIQSKYIL